jgi:hypothetical protein
VPVATLGFLLDQYPGRPFAPYLKMIAELRPLRISNRSMWGGIYSTGNILKSTKVLDKKFST